MRITLFPRQCSVLVLDLLPYRIRSEVFSGLNTFVVDTRYKEQLFLAPLLLAVTKKLLPWNRLDFSVNYLNSIVKFSRAKNVVGFSPLNIHHQQVAQVNGSVQFHFFQSGLMSTTSPRSSELPNDEAFSAGNVTNYIFGSSHRVSQISNQVCVNWGSLLNNLWAEELRSRKTFGRVIFVSQWRPYVDVPEKTGDEEFRLALTTAFKQTLSWSESRNVELAVLGNPKTAQYGSGEVDFYLRLAEGPITFIQPDNTKESYKACHESKFIATLNSALALEMLGCGKLVAFWGLDENQRPLLDQGILDSFFREIGLSIDSSCDLGVQLDFLLDLETRSHPSKELIKELMTIRSPQLQRDHLNKAFA